MSNMDLYVFEGVISICEDGKEGVRLMEGGWREGKYISYVPLQGGPTLASLLRNRNRLPAPRFASQRGSEWNSDEKDKTIGLLRNPGFKQIRAN